MTLPCNPGDSAATSMVCELPFVKSNFGPDCWCSKCCLVMSLKLLVCCQAIWLPCALDSGDKLNGDSAQLIPGLG